MWEFLTVHWSNIVNTIIIIGALFGLQFDYKAKVDQLKQTLTLKEQSIINSTKKIIPQSMSEITASLQQSSAITEEHHSKLDTIIKKLDALNNNFEKYK